MKSCEPVPAFTAKSNKILSACRQFGVDVQFGTDVEPMFLMTMSPY
jgi:hypothetical protein